MRNRFAFLVVTLLTLFTVQAHAQTYSSMFVLGDSLSDDGNNALLLPTFHVAQTIAPFNHDAPAPLVPVGSYAGSNDYSNGPVWVNYLAADLGLPLAPSLAGGTNFAFGGANTGPLGLPAVPSPIPSLISQASLAVASRAGALPGDALYVVWGGGNDLRDLADAFGGDLLSPIAATRQQAVVNLGAGISASLGNLFTAIDTLSKAGARDFLIPNLPDLGITPLARFLDSGAPGAAKTLTDMTVAFNASLDALITTAQSAPGFSVTGLNIFALNHAGVDPLLPSVNVTEACTSQNAFNGCDHPETFIYWDGIHPTTSTHQVIANAALAALPPAPVPLPASLPLAVGGIVMLAGVVRRRRAA